MVFSPQSDKKKKKKPRKKPNSFLPFIDISDITRVVNIKVKILFPL